MYEQILKDNLGKVVAVKTTAGIELIATLTGFDEDNHTLTLHKARLVVITDEEVAVVPYTFTCLLYTSPSPRDGLLSRMPSSA